MLVVEFSEFTLDGQAALTFFNVTDNPSVNVEAVGDVNDLLSMFGLNIYFHTMTHIEHFVHFCLICAALFGNGAE